VIPKKINEGKFDSIEVKRLGNGFLIVARGCRFVLKGTSVFVGTEYDELYSAFVIGRVLTNLMQLGVVDLVYNDFVFARLKGETA
jgi:hypothetical protein